MKGWWERVRPNFGRGYRRQWDSGEGLVTKYNPMKKKYKSRFINLIDSRQYGPPLLITKLYYIHYVLKTGSKLK